MKIIKSIYILFLINQISIKCQTFEDYIYYEDLFVKNRENFISKLLNKNYKKNLKLFL